MTTLRRGAEIVSVGYERRSLEDLIEMLTRNQVDVLVDVRLNPISRKRASPRRSWPQRSPTQASSTATSATWATPKRTAIFFAKA